MESQPKQRSPQSGTIISELENEFAVIVNDSPSTIMLNNKMRKFVQAIEEKTLSKCGGQIVELEKYATMENINGQTTLKRNIGMEADADRAIQNLQDCQAPFTNYMLALNMFSQYNLSLLSLSTDFCLDDCEARNINAEQSELKSCFRNCYDNSYKYVLRSAENLLSSQIDAANDELRKI